MLIDWFTVGAQVLNFLILVWLMKRFLYKPILNAIDSREKRIATELADADTKKTEAQKERDEFHQKNEQFDQQRAELLEKATEEAKTERQRLLEEARKAADALSAKRQVTLRNEAHNLNQAITRRTQDEVFAITRKLLADLATTDLEECMCDVFIHRLAEIDKPTKTRICEAITTTSEPALVRSAFELPSDQRKIIQKSINETFSVCPERSRRGDVPLRFETAPDLISGIELTTNGQKIAWSIADYLGSLEKGIGELLKEKVKPKIKAEPKPKAETKTESEPEAKSEAVAEDGNETKPKSKPKPKAKRKSKTKAESK